MADLPYYGIEWEGSKLKNLKRFYVEVMKRNQGVKTVIERQAKWKKEFKKRIGL